MKRTAAVIDGVTVSLSNLDKVFWPEDGYTKADLINYYVRIAPYLLPHLKDRPLVLTRYPEGIHGEWFYQKNTPAHAPAWLRRFPYRGERVVNYVLAENAAALAWLANQAALEIHPWMSRIDDLDRPDFAIFDLDPAEGATWDDVREIAHLLKKILDEFGLISFPKLSGATGLHVYLPLVRKYTYKDAAGFVELVARLLLEVYPERVTLERTVANRTGRVYVDYLQNIKGKTITSVYGARPSPGAPVSTPIHWEELPFVHPQSFNFGNIFDRLGRAGDLFAPVLEVHQEIDRAAAALRREAPRPRGIGERSLWPGESVPSWLPGPFHAGPMNKDPSQGEFNTGGDWK